MMEVFMNHLKIIVDWVYIHSKQSSNYISSIIVSKKIGFGIGGGIITYKSIG